MSLRISGRPALVVFAAFLGSCLIGFVAHGADILDPRMASFQFVTSGAIAGALATAFAFDRRKAVGLIASVALFVFLAAMRPDTGARVLRDLVYIPTLVASVWLSWVVGSKVSMARFGRVLVWGIAFALCHFAMFGILTAANGAAFDARLAYATTRIGGLVGVGVGLGVLLAGWRGGRVGGRDGQARRARQ